MQRRSIIHKVLFSILFLVILGLVVWRSITPETAFLGDDQAFSFAVASAALNEGRLPLLGQPSHFSGRHLGPFYYNVLIFLKMIASDNLLLLIRLLALLKVATVVAVLSIFSGVLSLEKETKTSTRVIVAMGILAIAVNPHYLIIYLLPWVNNFLLFPVALTLISYWYALKGGPIAFILFLICGSLAAQTFLGAIPLVAVFFLSLLAYKFSGGWKAFAHTFSVRRRYLFFPILVFFLIWLPPAIWEMQYKSNLLALFKRSPKGSALIEINDTVNLFFEFCERYALWTGANSLSLAVLVVGSALFFRVADIRQRIFIGAVFGATLLTLFALLSNPRPAHVFYLNGLLLFPLLIHGMLWAAVLKATDSRRAVFLAKPGIFCLLLVVLCTRFWTVLNHPIIFPSESTLKHKTRLTELLKRESGGRFSICAGRADQLLFSPVFLLSGDASAFSQFVYSKRVRELESFSRKHYIQPDVLFFLKSNQTKNGFGKALERCKKKYGKQYDFKMAERVNLAGYPEFRGYFILKAGRFLP